MTPSAWSTPDALRAQVLRYWESGRLLAAPLLGESLFPLELRLRGPGTRDLSERFEDVRQWIRDLESMPACEIHWAEINHRQLGRNRVPARILVPDESAALTWIGKQEDAARFRALTRDTLALFPELTGWLARRPLRALEHAEGWHGVLAVLQWFRTNPRSGLYLRQLDIAGVDTKFIESRKPLLMELLDVILPGAPASRVFEQRYGLVVKAPQIRFRILDPRLAIANLTDLAVIPSEFAALDLSPARVFLTENEINGLAFPPMPSSIVIFGLGYGLDRLSEAQWLAGRALYYWGDIDTYGFHILDRLRAIFPAVRSLLMDRETLVRHRALWVREPNPYTADLARLTPAERAVYDELRYQRLGESIRLEQERIPFGWVLDALRNLE